MQAAVHSKEEVACAAVEDDPELTVLQVVGGVEDRVVLPGVLMRVVVAKVLFYAPVCGEGGEVDAAAGGAGRAEELAVTDGEVEGAVAAHAEAGDGAMGFIGFCGVVNIDIGDEFFCDEGLVADGGVDWAVEVPAVVASVGADEEDVVLGGFFGELWGCLDPLGVVAAVAVEEVDDGHAGAGVGGGGYDDAFDVLVHGGAVDEDSVDGGGVGIRRDVYGGEYYIDEMCEIFHLVNVGK